MEKNEHLARLFKFEVSLNRDSKIVIDYEIPPHPDLVEKLFNKWDKEYEHTKKIVSLVKYLRDYGDKQCKDIQGFIS